MKRKDLDRLDEIKDAIFNMLDEAKELLACKAPLVVNLQARHWIADIERAVDEANSFDGHPTMGDTIAALEKTVEEDG